ncbi:MAG: DNA repair protein RadA [Candidatus Magasanikbacteria bacterium]|nr:DNA repair protein RadA [Candidatus Magasanikbacteria bacterium]
MKEAQTCFICSNCDAQFQKWVGRCLECGTWGTVAESLARTADISDARSTEPFDARKLLSLNAENSDTRAAAPRRKTHLADFDRLLGGGIVAGSLTLLGGEPGIGKSTLVLQLLHGITSHAESAGTVLYASGEETVEQITARAKRLKCASSALQFLPTTRIDEIIAATHHLHPVLVVVDSIQTMRTEDAPGEVGSVTQIKALTGKLLETAKKTGVPIFLIGHVTKDGSVAGPKTLEHLVDTVLYLEGDSAHDLRIIRATKNRFGSTNETSIFQMTEKGLLGVENPSALFLTDRPRGTPGSVIACIIEGSHPLLVEVQALVNRTVFGYPQRRASGFELNRLQVLIAVLITRAGVALENYDVHLNIVGGISVSDSAADAAVALAIASAFFDTAVPDQLAILGEVGLGGELRSVRALDRRITEISRMGFTSALIPRLQKKIPAPIQLIESGTIKDALARAGLLERK